MANETVVDPHEQREAEALANGRDIIDRLRRGDLPQMVDWFDPGLLAKVGVRSIISATLGSYTDQRLIQAATDNASEERLKNRYNFSGVGINSAGEKPVPSQALAADANGAVWVDYIADLGDGFEATYAMAYLLAADELNVAGEASPLPAGQLLIMGGDQVYPDATKQEYQTRLRDPYDWAFSTPTPHRKVFAIPGNHDWYDGLSAFSALFCSARDRISKGIGTQIGGWQCHQHRSYFAIKLPHNWWIWGPDIQLADNLDDSQRDYFDLMADQTSPDDNIILCIAEPSWLHKNYDNLHEISMLARKRGAKICAVIAGDWHHYSRYTSDQIGIQFVTCGGGGAFAHATHGLKSSIDLVWATPTGAKSVVASAADTTEFNRLERTAMGQSGLDFTQDTAPAAAPADTATTPEPKPISDLDAGPGGFVRRAKALRKEEIKSKTYPCPVQSIYPPRTTSRLLCLKNLALPFRNRPFTYLVGIIYFVYAWAYVAADPRQSPIAQNMVAAVETELSAAQTALDAAKRHHLAIDKQVKATTSAPPAAGSPEGMKLDMLSRQLTSAEGGVADRQKDVDQIQRRYDAVQGRESAAEREAFANRLDQIFHDPNLGFGGKLLAAAGALASNTLAYVLDMNALRMAAEQSPMFAFMLLGLWAGLVSYVESERRWVRVVIGSLHAGAHIIALLAISWFASATGIVPRFIGGFMHISDDFTRIMWNVFVTLFVGGLVGGLIMGLYWTLTSTLFNMHTGDAFGALGIKDYKNFLRIKLEPGRATIYPIALDRVPGRKGWRWQLNKGEQRPAHTPHVLPVSPLQPRMIENAPIVIVADKVLP